MAVIALDIGGTKIASAIMSADGKIMSFAMIYIRWMYLL